MVVIWSDYAQNDLKNYLKHSKIITENKAQTYINNLVDYVETLSTFPQLGKDFYSYKDICIKQLLYQMHRIFYYIENDKIIIMQVSHYSRSIDNIMRILKQYF